MTSFGKKQFVSRSHLISFVTLPFGWGEKFLTSSNPSTAIDRQTDNNQQKEHIATLTKGLSFIKKAMLAFCVLQHYIGLVVSITKYFWNKHIYSHFMRKWEKMIDWIYGCFHRTMNEFPDLSCVRGLNFGKNNLLGALQNANA